MGIATGTKARKAYYGRNGGPRSGLRAKHGGAYVLRLGVMGGRSRAQKIAARDADHKAGKA